ncbi:hypothetical protein [Sphingomonas sp.]|jgi:hypothetical protein|uniref:hypothetical protein n=1 Tax=Sphingomonas sp. TaxID=28214 RepID=UPI002D7E51EF|nr:hypothetical protein [Sphingomonas sp.]HEU0045584.1 hypothetical protein [Sphingomonas sp.]
MAITFEPARLDSAFGDSEAVLALRDGRLFAVLSRLGDLHGTLFGHWYVEAAFTVDQQGLGAVFPNLDAFEAHVQRQMT